MTNDTDGDAASVYRAARSGAHPAVLAAMADWSLYAVADALEIARAARPYRGGDGVIVERLLWAIEECYRPRDTW